MKKTMLIAAALIAAVWFAMTASTAQSAQKEPQKAKGWPQGNYFRVGQAGGRAIFIDPKGRPFYSRAMVYAYGPENGPMKGKVTAEFALQELEIMKKHGFNTLDLYGDAYLQDMLKWCDDNEFGLYFRTSYTSKEFPDFMDPAFRDEAKHSYDTFLANIKGHPCVLAVDMDQRWLFELDWTGRKRYGIPKLGPESVKNLPAWLEEKYKDISGLNRLWGKDYSSFADILADNEIISQGKIADLDRKPWRVDIVEYASWVVNDFLRDLTAYMRIIDPDHMITCTTELPEVAPFPISTKKNSGIDFISPVHYNLDLDYNRDWIANAKLIFQTKFHSDMSGLPVFINESGFRTTWLEATPENMGYAAARLGDEGQIAELYLRQGAVTASYPWMLGWGWFKWYDKLFEGDFGYIRDDRSFKPISDAGQYATGKFAVNMEKEKNPKAWVYYPEYALASPLASFPQGKTLMLLLENDYLSEYEKAVKEIIPELAKPGGSISGSRLVNNLPDLFNQKWYPFAFTPSIPDDRNVILLAGGSLEQLSMADRAALAGRKTITFGPVGLTDERYNKTEPWYLEVVGIPKDVFSEKAVCVGLGKAYNDDGKDIPYDLQEMPAADKIIECRGGDTVFAFPERSGNGIKNIKCAGQVVAIPEGIYSNVNFLMASDGGDIAAKVILIYSDGSSDEQYFAPSIADWRSVPHFGHTAVGTVSGGYMSHLAVPASPSRNLTSIRLPYAPIVHIFAITLTEGGIAKDVTVEVEKGNISSSGICYWALSVPQDKNARYKVLATFKNGNPAIVQSKDGRHIAYLYDPLTWGNKANEISADIGNQSEILKSLLGR